MTQSQKKKERKPAEQLLEDIVYVCFDALDPILTREQLILKIREIYHLAEPDDEDDPGLKEEDWIQVRNDASVRRPRKKSQPPS